MPTHSHDEQASGLVASRARVLVTDGEQRSALAVVRSLGMAGHEVYVCSADRRSLAGGSRHARAEAVVPDPLQEPAAFRMAVRELVTRWRPEVVLPMTEASALELLVARDDLAGARIPFPQLERFRRISDKAEVMRVAPEVGISVPRQAVMARREDPIPELAFPVVAKPSRSVVGESGHRAKTVARHVTDRATLATLVAALPEDAFPLLVQERIVGDGEGIFLLRWEGETLARFAHRRLREKPPSGGVSVYRESIPADPELVRRAEALLDRFDWSGVAMVEFKRDVRTGEPYLMEINGRFWGSLQLAIDAGVDFPVLLLAAAAGRPVRQEGYTIGVRSRWEWGEMDHLLARLRKSNAALALPPSAPGRARAVLDVLRIRSGDRLEILRLDDPRPFLRESREWLRRLVSGR